MSPDPVRQRECRRTSTPNADMTTLASPTQGPTSALSLWLVSMTGGQQGPRHRVDSEQVWHLTGGRARVAVAETVTDLEPGDTLVLPAGAVRQVTALGGASFVVCGDGRAEATVVTGTGEDEARGTPPWIR